MILNVIEKQKTEDQLLDTQAEIFKVLSHPSRIDILNILRDGEHCVCHLEAHMGFRQAYISQQLAVLREAGLIQDRREGWNIFYRVCKPEIFDVLDAVQKITGQTKFSSSKSGVVCSCPHCSKKTG
jgi:DNA-binding transcriptional ArsR family regulator